ncbi:hypothetical protein HDC92_002701 [Pedobacter sp. AK017]|uniref:CBM96 family carbohydrate-binding protein n=1 Tax=Pedobacter sp. AK017 TaxID=2723073 RepID=UPI00161B7C1F|nr:DNRLRE domain-containing protein [Pedobacter sp. AK017]MBB5439017.1 hypothetical protein [Pedobacter sp. AK017]
MKKVFLFLTIALCFSQCKKAGNTQSAESANSRKQSVTQTPTSLQAAAATDFTVIFIPDTQYYMDEDSHGGTYSMFVKQIDWIIANKTSQNIVYVGGLGDIVDNGNNVSEWNEAKTQYARLSAAGIPYGLSVGNHDQYPNGTPGGNSTAEYNARFGRTEFHNRTHYGGNYLGPSSNNNDSHYDLFTAGGIDFIVIHVEYDATEAHGLSLNNWVDEILATHSSRKAIVVTHYVINGSGAFSSQASLLYNKIKYRPNLFMMYGGHISARVSNTATTNGNVTRLYLADYQGEPNGGEGFLRILKFRPDLNVVETKSYSPYLNQYLTAANEQFTHTMFTFPYVYPVALNAVADAHVRDGVNGNVNYGTATLIVQRASPAVNSSYKTYLKFDLNSITQPIKSAKLRVFGNSNVTGTGTCTINCYGNGDAWTETGLTWNNAPAVVNVKLASTWVNSLNKYHEFDVTGYVQEQAAGDKIVSLQLNMTANQDKQCNFYSKENAAAANRPQLFIYH